MCELRLSAEQRAILDEFKAGRRSVLKRCRKNAGVVIPILNELIADGEGHVFTSDLADLVRELGEDGHWDLGEGARDGLGLQRALGDLLGKHFLGLPRGRFARPGGGKEAGYALPAEPITGEWLRERGWDPATVDKGPRPARDGAPAAGGGDEAVGPGEPVEGPGEAPSSPSWNI